MVCIVMFAFASFQLPIANAHHDSIIWGSAQKQTEMEGVAEYITCQCINNFFADHFIYWQSMNGYGPDTCASNVYGAIDYVEWDPNCDLLVTFHVGNWFSSPKYSDPYWYYSEETGWILRQNGPTTHECYYGWDDTSDPIVDRDLPSSSKSHFTFVYTCANGGLSWKEINGQIVNDELYGFNDLNSYLYGFVDTDNSTGRVGMPFVWLGMQNLRHNGYYSPDGSDYCYIGFQGRDHDLSQNWEDHSWGGTYSYKDFVLAFYYYLTNVDPTYSVNAALNYASNFASQGVYDYFSQTDLYNGYTDGYDNRSGSATQGQWVLPGQMRVFGDGDMFIPNGSW
jgi:hypothetical protein